MFFKILAAFIHMKQLVNNQRNYSENITNFKNLKR